MKKKIIMLGIILISTASLLLVMFYIKTKDIKYISSNEINDYGITMLLETEEGQTNITEAPTEGYYKIQYTCDNNAVIAWNNISHKIKIKATTIPVRCTLAFTEVIEDFNIVAMYVDGEETTSILDNDIEYYLQSYVCKNKSNQAITNITITYNPFSKKINMNPINDQIYCELYFITRDGYKYSNGNRIPDDWKFVLHLANLTTEQINNLGTFENFAANQNAMTAVGNSENAMRYLISGGATNSSSVLYALKHNSSYLNDTYQYLLNGNGLTNEEKYIAGLPCKVLDYSNQGDIIGGLMLRYSARTDSYFGKTGLTAPYILNLSYANNMAVVYGTNPVNITSFSKMIMNYSLFNDAGSVSPTNLENKAWFGLTSSGEYNNQRNNTTYSSSSNFVTVSNYDGSDKLNIFSNLSLDINSFTGPFYIKIVAQHGDQINVNTTVLQIKYIYLI